MFLDIVAVAIVGFGFYRGFTKGFVVTLFSMIAWMIGLVAALRLTAAGSDLFRDWFDSTSAWIPIVTFVIIFVAVVILVILFAKLIDQIITVAQLGLWNKLAGGVLEGAFFLLVLSILYWMLQNGGVITPETRADSKLYATISPVAPGFFKWLGNNVPALKDLLDNLKPYFNQFKLPDLPKLDDVKEGMDKLLK
jgi:membrane protein required for colicin V production